MFIKVQPLKGPPQPLLYRISTELAARNLVGMLVEVPLRTRTIHALVVEQGADLADHVSYSIRDMCSLSSVPYDQHYYQFLTHLAHYHQLNVSQLLRRLHGFLTAPQKQLDQLEHEIADTINATLTSEQQQAYDAIAPTLFNQIYAPTVLHGVTGSGKTEIYKKLMNAVYAQGKTTIFMIPEVSLAIQFATLFRQTFNNNIPVIGFHSASTPAEKQQLWQTLLAKKPLIIVGVHQPTLVPISNLGLIIIDEEHAPGYQEKKYPKINSKEAALMRAQQYNIPIVLGSATPSITSLYNVEKRNWLFVQLTKRYRGAFPVIQVVYLTNKTKRKHNFWISRELEDALCDRLARKEQTIIFLNRRGYSFFVQCKNCAHIFTCKHCAVSMTLHSNNQLHCHYCGFHLALPAACPACKHTEFINKGIGTQQVVDILQRLFPTARIARADLDTTRKKKLWQQTFTDFNNGTLDILVGTQTVTKGYHFRNVTLVGALWADMHLNLPHFSAAETTLQQLIQVAGRAGREQPHSTVIIQAMAPHPIFSALNEIDYLTFYRQELANRQLLSYPPYGRLCEIELVHKQEAVVARESCVIAKFLQQLALAQLTVLGPATPSIAKIKDIHRRTIYLKASSYNPIDKACTTLKQLSLRSMLHINPSS